VLSLAGSFREVLKWCTSEMYLSLGDRVTVEPVPVWSIEASSFAIWDRGAQGFRVSGSQGFRRERGLRLCEAAGSLAPRASELGDLGSPRLQVLDAAFAPGALVGDKAPSRQARAGV